MEKISIIKGKLAITSVILAILGKLVDNFTMYILFSLYSYILINISFNQYR